MQSESSRYHVKLAQSDSETLGAQRLRYRVFVEEKGATAPPEQQAKRLEWDAFDPYFDQIVLICNDPEITDPLDRVVGVYRLMTDDAARAGLGFYGASEYDLSLIEKIARPSVELGRSCVAPEHRNGVAMHLLWNGLSEYVLGREIEILFGVASFHGVDPAAIAQGLSLLHRHHLAPPDLRVRALADHFVDMNLVSDADFDRATAKSQIPPLIQGYLRLGGWVGEGAYIDHDFNTIDVCIVMDIQRMTEQYRTFYQRNRASSS